MAEKIIIENETNKPMNDILNYVALVIQKGRISDNGKQYCYHTQFNNGIQVSAFKNNKSDRFVVFGEI